MSNKPKMAKDNSRKLQVGRGRHNAVFSGKVYECRFFELALCLSADYDFNVA